MLKGMFVDDRQEEKSYAKLLEEASAGKAEVNFMAPNFGATELAEHLISANLDFVALDFRLDEVPVPSPDHGVPNANRYKASAVAQHFRDRVVDDPKLDIPLVLLSQEDYITTMFSRDTTALDLFDLVLEKQVLTEARSSEVAAQKVVSTAIAYQVTKSALGKGKMVTNLCGIDERSDGHVLDHQAIRAIDRLEYAHQVVPKIRKLLIDQPGILISNEHLLARLGIATDSAGIAELFEVLGNAGAAYRGILCDGWPRWWWHRIDAWTKSVIGETPGAIRGSERATRLNKALGISLTAAKSRWTNSSDEYFWVACSCCRQPTELDHTVLVYLENYPPFLEPLRVCWRCIQTGDSKDIEIDDSDSELVKKLQSGQLVE